MVGFVVDEDGVESERCLSRTTTDDRGLMRSRWIKSSVYDAMSEYDLLNTYDI